MEKEIEIWKDIDNYVGFYQISNLGNIKSLKRKIFKSNTIQHFKERILKQSISNNGYYIVSLRKYNSLKSFTVHRLVAESFIIKDKNKPIINHLDGNKLNNLYSNLEWCTYSENINHAYDTGLMTSVKGEDRITSKLTENEVLDIRNLAGTMFQKEIAEIYNIDKSVVCRIINRKAWNHI